MVVFAGDTDPLLPHGRQRVDQAGIVAPTGAGFQQVYSADAISDDVAHAFGRARAERRPIVLNVTVDVQRRSTTYQPTQVNIAALQAIAPDPAALDLAAGAIADARRPVILAGRGAVLAEARTQLTALAARIGAPLATTVCAKDYFRGEPFDLGICGSLSHQIATDTILAADCLIVFGASLNTDTTAEGSLLEGERIVQVDLESAHLGRHAPVAAAVHADAAQTAVTSVDWFDEVNLPRSGTLCTPELAERLAQHDPRAEFTAQRERYGRSPRTDTTAGCGVQSASAPMSAIQVCSCCRVTRGCTLTEPSAFIETVAFGSIGLGLATAVGAAVGRPDRPTLVTVGDGGLTMGVAELLTAARYGLDMVVVVYNDGAYGAELAITDRIGMGHDLPLLGDVNFAAVAEAMGVPAVRIEGPDQLDRIATALARSHGSAAHRRQNRNSPSTLNNPLWPRPNPDGASSVIACPS